MDVTQIWKICECGNLGDRTGQSPEKSDLTAGNRLESIATSVHMLGIEERPSRPDTTGHNGAC